MDQSELKPYQPGNPHLFGCYLDCVMGYSQKSDWSHFLLFWLYSIQVFRTFRSNYSLACTLLLHVLLQGTSLKHKISTQWAHRSVHVPPHMQDTPSNTSKYTMNFWQVIAWSKSVNYNLFYDKQLNMCTTPGRTNKGLIKTNTNSCTGCSTRSMTCMTKGWLKDAWLSKCMCAPRLAPTTSCILLVIIHLFTPTQPLVMTCMVAQKQDYCTIWSTAKKSSVSARGCSLKQNKETF